jgi:hypothetical protein
MERTRHSTQAHLASGATPGLVQAIQQAALATEAEGWHDVAVLLRGWAERLDPRAVQRETRGEPWQPEIWLG